MGKYVLPCRTCERGPRTIKCKTRADCRKYQDWLNQQAMAIVTQNAARRTQKCQK